MLLDKLPFDKNVLSKENLRLAKNMHIIFGLEGQYLLIAIVRKK